MCVISSGIHLLRAKLAEELNIVFPPPRPGGWSAWGQPQDQAGWFFTVQYLFFYSTAHECCQTLILLQIHCICSVVFVEQCIVKHCHYVWRFLRSTGSRIFQEDERWCNSSISWFPRRSIQTTSLLWAGVGVDWPDSQSCQVGGQQLHCTQFGLHHLFVGFPRVTRKYTQYLEVVHAYMMLYILLSPARYANMHQELVPVATSIDCKSLVYLWLLYQGASNGSRRIHWRRMGRCIFVGRSVESQRSIGSGCITEPWVPVSIDRRGWKSTDSVYLGDVRSWWTSRWNFRFFTWIFQLCAWQETLLLSIGLPHFEWREAAYFTHQDIDPLELQKIPRSRLPYVEKIYNSWARWISELCARCWIHAWEQGQCWLICFACFIYLFYFWTRHVTVHYCSVQYIYSTVQYMYCTLLYMNIALL